MITNEYVTFTIGKKKNIALIAHDNEKPKLIQWCKDCLLYTSFVPLN